MVFFVLPRGYIHRFRELLVGGLRRFMSMYESIMIGCKNIRLGVFRCYDISLSNGDHVLVAFHIKPKPISFSDISKVVQIYEEAYLIVFCLLATQSALEYVISRNRRILLFVAPTQEIYGGLFDYGEKMKEILDELFGYTTVRNNIPVITIDGVLASQWRGLLERALVYLHDKILSLEKDFTVEVVCRFIRKIRRMIKNGISEIKINDTILDFLGSIGFKVLDISNKPGHADIIAIHPLPLIAEIKIRRATGEDVDQLAEYIYNYTTIDERTKHLRLDWRPILIARGFSLEAVDGALARGISLMTFKSFMRLILLITIYGVSPGELKHILSGGRVDKRISRLLLRKRKMLDNFAKFLSCLRQLRYYDKIGGILPKIRALANIHIDEHVAKAYLDVLSAYPFNFVSEKHYNDFAFIYIFRLLSLIWRQVRGDENIPVCLNI